MIYRKPLKIRKNKKISKKKIVNMINLFEKLVDEEIISIDIFNNEIRTHNGKYLISLPLNIVEGPLYDDPE